MSRDGSALMMAAAGRPVWQGPRRRPARVGGEAAHRLDGAPLGVGHDRQKGTVADDRYDAGQGADRRVVERLQRRAIGRRPDHAGVEEALGPQVLHIDGSAGQLGGNVEPRHGPVDDGVGGRWLQRGAGRGVDVDQRRRDEIAIAEPPPVRRHDAAGLGVQRFRGQSPARGGLTHEDVSDLGGGGPDGAAAVLHGMAAGRVAFVGRGAGVGRVDRHGGEREVELLGGELRQRRGDPLPELGLAGQHFDPARRFDPDPAVEQRRLLQAAGQVGAARWRRCPLLRLRQPGPVRGVTRSRGRGRRRRAGRSGDRG